MQSSRITHKIDSFNVGRYAQAGEHVRDVPCLYAVINFSSGECGESGRNFRIQCADEDEGIVLDCVTLDGVGLESVICGWINAESNSG
jgi:hypothetical protein